jgi:CRP-like cAMP-binding protein
MFKEYDSENLIRKLAVVLESTIYLPGDFILYKGDIGEEMYFIAEGSVRSLSDDKQTITRSLHKGSFFGETAILFPTKRSNFIQAETFCIIRVLKGEDFRWVAQDFPDIHKKLQERAAQTKDDSNDDDSISGKGGGIDTMKILSTNELNRFHEDHMNLKPVIE